ncbi:ubiquinone/menaquinone biosynthesis methyltransferase [Rubripirellula lacrimiformis]|uniref:Ubiquinone/menaquinone biosynthesis methyltransferase n=1 Tax=Rubripirellula lacrimiformis TaxID=1930273 RepID=A0A517NC48_9BACT|nr:class I SAM-dependent methyltransferase [Rubripirellula lacrimiformis]QDT04588.1 ubiquinone/menaquinone biosynthesis methyltransferase [Rubripirellula lacrimiformis]
MVGNRVVGVTEDPNDTPGPIGSQSPPPIAGSRGYDRLAAVYRPLEWWMFGDDLQRGRTALLDDLPPARQILVLGDGDGRLMQQIGRQSPDAMITSVDNSKGMLEHQQRRIQDVGATDRVRFVHQDARDFPCREASVDLLVMAFFLDCFTESDIDEFLPNWIRTVRPGGHVYVAEFAVPGSGWHAVRAKLMLAAMHCFFRWTTDFQNRRLVDLDCKLESQSLRKSKCRTRNKGLIQTQIWQRAGQPTSTGCNPGVR